MGKFGQLFETDGFHLIAVNIFLHMDLENLVALPNKKTGCELINKRCQEILNNPIFWIKKFVGLSKKNRKDWIKAIKSVKTEKMKQVVSYLKLLLKEGISDEPSFTTPMGQKNILFRIHHSASHGNLEVIKILAPLSNKPDAKGGGGYSAIHFATFGGFLEIVRFLAPISDNPNVSDDVNGETSIFKATKFGRDEIIEILAPLSENPNAPDHHGTTPIINATLKGFTSTVRLLINYVDNPNQADNQGRTPIYWARRLGRTEIEEILQT